MTDAPDISARIALAREAKARADRATPGPWLNDENCVYVLQHRGWYRGKETFENRFSAVVQGKLPDEERNNTSMFIAAARTDVPALADAVLALVERVKDLEGSR